MTFLEENAKLKGQLKYTKNNDIEKNNDRDSPMKTKKKSKSKSRKPAAKKQHQGTEKISFRKTKRFFIVSKNSKRTR